MAAAQLLVTDGAEPGAFLSVDPELVLGRVAPDEAGRLGGDAELSRRHARVWRGADEELTIEDLGSANGTFVNGERIDGPRRLRAGDHVRVGRSVLTVTIHPAGVLVVTEGAARGLRLTLGDELVIGRAVSGDGRLGDDPELSRRHARIALDPTGQVTVEDLGSANGTFLNGERVRGPRALHPGDSLRVGATVLQLLQDSRPPPEPVVQMPPLPSRPQVPAGAPPMALRVGSVFAGCRIEGVISHGDMGVVYRADELALHRQVALKLILPDLSSDERFRERFRRESRIAAAIDHPNVIPVFDAGEADGVLYIMMRLVDGTDLRALIDAGGALEPLRAARIVQQVGGALDAAHARGMLHRDVKPSNILLARRDHVYLTDFGLAKRVDAGDGLTRQGTIVARAMYVAPEQILNRRVDARSDIYALACVLFEALTGTQPFAGWSGGPDVLAHLEAPRPSPRALRPELPPAYEEVIRRGMATDPDERYPSAGDLGRAALVAAGGLGRAEPWSMVATGEAAPARRASAAQPAAEADPGQPEAQPRRTSRDALRWAIAFAGLVIVAVGMVAALSGISSLR